MENRKRVRDGYRGGKGTTTADNARKQTAYHSALLRDVLRPSGGWCPMVDRCTAFWRCARCGEIVRICSVSAPLAPICSTPSAPTMHRICPKAAPRLHPRCTAYLPISHRTNPKTAPNPRQTPPTYALGNPRAAVAAAPRAPRFARSREGVAWAAIWEREMGGHCRTRPDGEASLYHPRYSLGRTTQNHG